MDMENKIHEDGPVKQNTTDGDFTPPVEMMVHDYDDERTLEEEEALGPLEDPQVELLRLQRESSMPLKDLLVMYGGLHDQDGTITNSSEEMNGDRAADGDNSLESKPEPSELEQLYNDSRTEMDSMLSMRPTRFASRGQSEDEEDYDYCPSEEEDKKKTIMVGSDYQAWIPDVPCKYGDALPYENSDKLVWDPNEMSLKDIEDYLIKATEPLVSSSQGVTAIPTGSHLRDDEEALFLLLQCGHNVEEALRRRKMNTVPPNQSMTLWSEEECRNFETGLRTFGKDFRQIQQNKVRTRSVGELVQFYYLWKKTERHDIFANKARLEKKKYALHPGITDYMDRFLEEQEGAAGRDRSTSPNIHSLLYGDHKWQKTNDGASEGAAAPVGEETKVKTEEKEKSPEQAESKDEAPSPKKDGQ